MRKLIAAAALLLALAGPMAPARAQSPNFGGGNQTYSAFLQTGQVPLSATGTTSRAALGSAAPVAWVCNAGTVTAYVTLGSSTVVATVAAGFPILSGTCGALFATGATNIAGITATGTAALVAATGSGHP